MSGSYSYHCIGRLHILHVSPSHHQLTNQSRLGALLTGTGRFNYAFPQACGLNRDAAVTHFRRALELDPGHEAAQQALAFCEAEARDEALWAERVAAAKAEIAGVLAAAAAAQADEEQEQEVAAAAAAEEEAAPASTAVQEVTDEEDGTLAADASPLQVLRAVLKRQLRGVFRLLRQLVDAAMGLVACLQGIMAAAGAAGGGGEGEDDFGKWINGQRIRTVPRVKVTSGAELMRIVKKHQPVVITNFEDDYAPPEAWTREALKAKFGHMPVRVSLSQTGRFDGPEEGTLWCVRHVCGWVEKVVKSSRQQPRSLISTDH